MSAKPAAVYADAVIVGAGPVGLFQVFQLGLHGLHAHVIEARPHIGGQCAELYPDKPIYDIPGISQCTGRELVAQLARQMATFAPTLHLDQQVVSLKRAEDQRLLLSTSTGLQIATRSVFIAAGVGAFLPRTINAPGMKQLAPHQVFYHPSDLACATGQHVIIHGADEIALRAALDCLQHAASVTVVHRRDVFQAPAALLATWQALRAAGQIHVAIGQLTQVHASPSGQLQSLTLQGTEGQSQQLAATMLLAWPSISPRLGPVLDWGLTLEHKQLLVDTAQFRTSEPGIYAVGDINTYPGKRKLILCGFHEATLAAFAAAEYLSGQPVALQYTTTSTRLHERLKGRSAPPQSP